MNLTDAVAQEAAAVNCYRLCHCHPLAESEVLRLNYSYTDALCNKKRAS